MTVELHPWHFSDWDRNELIRAGQILMGWAHEWVFHEAEDATWYRDFEDDVVETVAELERILDAAQQALSQARGLFHSATAAARLRALNEQRRRPAHGDGPGARR